MRNILKVIGRETKMIKYAGRLVDSEQMILKVRRVRDNTILLDDEVITMAKTKKRAERVLTYMFMKKLEAEKKVENNQEMAAQGIVGLEEENFTAEI